MANNNFRVDINNVPRHKRQLDSAIQRALDLVGERVSSNVAQITPVDTGALRNSISHRTMKDAVLIGSNLKYALYVEVGTIKMRAANRGKGYLRYGIQQSRNDIKTILEGELRNL
jgi:phage gpG-like protein